ncbi:MAG TPA: ATP-binding protein [Chloroflexota bacterium]|nr:ATP-binding protein [Chloroflexota bacterium]
MNTQLLHKNVPQSEVRLALPHSQRGEIEHLLEDALHLPADAVGYVVSRWLGRIFPGMALLEVVDGHFHLGQYAEAGLCALTSRPDVLAETRAYWEDEDEGITVRVHNGWFMVHWQGEDLEVLAFHCGPTQFSFIMGQSRQLVERFYAAVCAWNAEVHGEVLAYNGHCWYKDEDLFKAIQGATFDNLVLGGNLKEAIHADLVQFFASRATYEEYGIPWKRGILFLGPPGNGKTYMVKALLNRLGKPCLYVQSLARGDQSIRAVYAQARRSAPCIVVFEDLDALVKAEHRSVLLNEMDGFAANTGIVTLATTNHPEKLDPALIDRPSRFDRKYHFGLPAPSDRRAYIARWNATLQPALRASETVVDRIAKRTEGFSYAYLKELCLSATMRWLVIAMPGAMDLVLDEQLESLRAQMASTKEATVAAKNGSTHR